MRYWKYILRRCILKHIGAGKDADAGAIAGQAHACARAGARDFGEQWPFAIIIGRQL